MSTGPPICECGSSEGELNGFCTKCRNVVLVSSSQIQRKDPARTRMRRKPRTTPPGERETFPGVSRNAMVDPRRALHENYSKLYAREQQLLQAVAELEHHMALRNQPLPQPPPTRQTAPIRRSGKSSPTDLDVDLLADAFGVMSVRDRGNVQFIGPTAISEYILQQCDGITQRKSSRRSPNCCSPNPETLRPPLKCFEDYPEIILLDAQFPSPPPQPPTDLRRFLPHLPEYERAQNLIDNYIYFVTWLTSPIPLSVLPETLNLIYPDKTRTKHVALSKGHNLASLFAIFMLGTHFDLTLPDEVRMSESAKYLTLARATMSCVPLLVHATAAGIQCMVLLIWFSRFSPTTGNSPGYQWAFSGFLTRLVQSLGLHRNGRDDYTYIQDERTILRAEQTFWEYYTQDVFQSYVYGRPVTLHPSVVTCQLPQVEVYKGYHPEYFKWKYSMTMMMTEVIETTLQPTITYDSVIKLDRRIRHHAIPSGMEWPNSDIKIRARSEPVGKTLQRAFGSILTQMILMILHRPYFWEAISKPNLGLVQHRYWRSVVAAYHGATSLVSSILTIWQNFPKVIERLAPFWSHCHSASLVLGALATLRPDSQFTPQSLRHLDAACEAFKTLHEGGLHLASRLPALYRLQKKAQEAYSNYLASADMSVPELSSPASLSCMDESESTDPNSRDSHDDIMELDPGVYRLQEKGWDHLILQLGRCH